MDTLFKFFCFFLFLFRKIVNLLDIRFKLYYLKQELRRGRRRNKLELATYEKVIQFLVLLLCVYYYIFHKVVGIIYFWILWKQENI